MRNVLKVLSTVFTRLLQDQASILNWVLSCLVIDSCVSHESEVCYNRWFGVRNSMLLLLLKFT